MNDQSLVLKIQWNNRSVLFTGDITENAEIELSREDSDLKSEVLKVPHHGSKRSSSYPFARAVSPKFAIISVGRNNPYGHPHQKVVSRYEGLGATVLRTDLCGMIQMEGSSLGWDVKTYLKCASFPLLR
jgi:competence protein ComEC